LSSHNHSIVIHVITTTIMALLPAAAHDDIVPYAHDQGQ
jgi:hypothetical protein